MKTITDAVNELKGDWPVLDGIFPGWSYYSPENIAFDNEKIYFPKSEFDAHVKELTGCPIKLKQWQDSKMNKTIKDAYEDLKGDLGNSLKPLSSDKFVYFDKDKDDYMCFHDKAKCKRKYQYICTVEEFINYGKSIEEVKLVYTKAMQDDGELPSVGMQIHHTIRGLCIIEYIYDSCGETHYMYRSIEDKVYNSTMESRWITPIDTRTDKEKAIDELLKEHREEFPFDSAYIVASMAYDKWVK